MLSTSRNARVVPEGIVTFLGGGGGGGVDATAAAGAEGGAMAATGAAGAGGLEGGVCRTRGSCRRGLGAGEGLVSSAGAGGGGACAIDVGEVTCKLFMTCLTPGSAAA